MSTIIAAVIAGVSLVAVAVINRKLDQIHVLVNQRMTDALSEIKALRTYVEVTAKPGDPPVPPPTLPPTTPDV